ncbi:MAG: galactokinase [Pseudomonadota bacterium]
MTVLSAAEQPLLDEAVREFEHAYGRPPSVAAIAPGRVNLIGDHTDYTDGLCLPFAIDRYVAIVGAPAQHAHTRLRSTQSSDMETIELSPAPLPIVGNWSDYVRGVIEGLRDHDVHAPPMDMMIHSNLPTGAGLSSSAALEVGVAHFLLAAAGQERSNATIVALTQQAEHRYAGVPCGTMDQFSVANGVAGAFMMLDNRSLTAQTVVPADRDLGYLVVNSGVSHDLADGGYADRRSGCEAAEQALGKSLRDTTLAELASVVTDPTAFKRATHVISENARVTAMVSALETGNRDRIAALMYAGHQSLRDDFENSVPEIDLLVALASDMRSDGVVGARMTGGGFGGAVIVPAAVDTITQIADALTEQYRKATQIDASWLVVTPSAGARNITEALSS